MNQDQEHDMDTNTTAEHAAMTRRLQDACDTAGSAVRTDLRSRLARASRPARRIALMRPVD